MAHAAETHLHVPVLMKRRRLVGFSTHARMIVPPVDERDMGNVICSVCLFSFLNNVRTLKVSLGEGIDSSRILGGRLGTASIRGIWGELSNT